MAQRKDYDKALWATIVVWSVVLTADLVLRVNNISAPEIDGTLAALTGLMVGNLTTKSKDNDKPTKTKGQDNGPQ